MERFMRQTDRQADRQTDRNLTERQRNEDRKAVTKKQRERQTETGRQKIYILRKQADGNVFTGTKLHTKKQRDKQ